MTYICHDCGETFETPKYYTERGECFGAPYAIQHEICRWCGSDQIDDINDINEDNEDGMDD